MVLFLQVLRISALRLSLSKRVENKTLWGKKKFDINVMHNILGNPNHAFKRCNFYFCFDLIIFLNIQSFCLPFAMFPLLSEYILLVDVMWKWLWTMFQVFLPWYHIKDKIKMHFDSRTTPFPFLLSLSSVYHLFISWLYV